jgi:hypothetical protein
MIVVEVQRAHGERLDAEEMGLVVTFESVTACLTAHSLASTLAVLALLSGSCLLLLPLPFFVAR